VNPPVGVTTASAAIATDPIVIRVRTISATELRRCRTHLIVVHNVHLAEVRRQLPDYNGDVHSPHMAVAWRIMLPGLGPHASVQSS